VLKAYSGEGKDDEQESPSAGSGFAGSVYNNLNIEHCRIYAMLFPTF
jgi:hypothetical protein